MDEVQRGRAGRTLAPSFWLEACGEIVHRAPLDTPMDVDVAIVGGGLTGLWTALHLRRAAPDCRIVVIEREYCGFGASGRNGGWCSALFPASYDALAAAHGAARAHAQLRAMIDTVRRIEADLVALGIDCDWARGGTVTLATNPAHVGRLRAALAQNRRAGFGDDDLAWASRSETESIVRVGEQHGSIVTPHCAAVQPARLVLGLAAAVESIGVTIVEDTAVTALEPGVVTTDRGGIRADVVLRCTEAYTPGVTGRKRAIVPLYSMMIATEPLPDATWDEIGLHDRPTFSDGRHLLIYGQRTADGRFAFGGRGAPYHFGSAVRDEFDTDESVAAELTRTLHELFPATRAARVTHHWGGPLGAPRDWCASVGLDRASGLGWAGGYVGDGVATTHLAGRTLADLVLGHDTDVTRLPWVQHRSPEWEPEPLRWLAINAVLGLAGRADRREDHTRRPARHLERIISRVTGE